MKSINDIRARLNELSETTDDAEMRKLSTLVRSGLFDAKKLTLLKRALNKDNLKMTKAERDTLLELLDKLLNVVTTNQGVFQKVKQSVSEDLVLEDYEFSMARSQLKTIIRDAQALLDQIQGEGEMESWMQSKITLAADYIGAVTDNVVSGESEIKKLKEDYEEISLEEAKELVSVDINQIPSMLILKRRSIRVFPDGQKVALYYSDRLNKFVTVPFTSIGLSEETLEERNVDWAWEQGYRKRHAAANDDTLSPAERANAAAELSRYHAMTTSRFGKPAATSLQSTFDKAQGQAQAAKAAAKARAKAMADRGLSDKMARRAAKQGEIRDTLKSTIPRTFGAAYRATGSLAGAAGVATGVALRKALLNIKSVRRGEARAMRPGAGPIRESFESKLQNLREDSSVIQLKPRTQLRPADVGLTGSGSANDNIPRPAFRPKTVKRIGPSIVPKIKGPGRSPIGDLDIFDFLPISAAGKWFIRGLDPGRPAGGESEKEFERMVNRDYLAKKTKDLKGFSAPVPTAPDATPPAQPAVQPKTDKTPQQQTVIQPAAVPNVATSAAPAAATQSQTQTAPKGRSRPPRPQRKRGKGLDIGGTVSPWDISAGKGKKNEVGKIQGIDPFASQVTGGPYGTQALTQKLGKIQRDATKAMAKMEEQTRSWGSGLNNTSANNSQSTSQSGSNSGGKEWDITEPQPKASDKLKLDTLRGINPVERMAASAKGGPYSTPALDAYMNQLNIKAQRAMAQQQYESVLAELQNMISENIQSKELQIGEEYITINNGMAKKIVHVYESVNKINKVKMEKMLNENVDSFTKVLQFATKN